MPVARWRVPIRRQRYRATTAPAGPLFRVANPLKLPSPPFALAVMKT